MDEVKVFTATFFRLLVVRAGEYTVEVRLVRTLLAVAVGCVQQEPDGHGAACIHPDGGGSRRR